MLMVDFRARTPGTYRTLLHVTSARQIWESPDDRADGRTGTVNSPSESTLT